MQKISQILDEIDNLKKVAFIPNPQISNPQANPELGQAYQQVEQMAQGLPPQAQQQLQQQLQQLQQLPPDQQQQALQQLAQQVQQATAQSQGGSQGAPGQGQSQAGDPSTPPQESGQPSSGGGNDPGASNLSSLDSQQITLTLSDLLNLVSGGKHSKTTAAIHGSKRDAELQSQMLELKHKEKVEDYNKKQQEKELQEQQQQAMAQQQASAGNVGGGGIYPGGMNGQTPQP